MPSWRVYAADRRVLSPGEHGAYLQDFVASKGEDGSAEERVLFSRVLREDASLLRSHDERVALARSVRYLTRERAAAEAWTTELALRTLFQVQPEVQLVPGDQLSLDVLMAFCNLLQHDQQWTPLMAALYMQALMRVVADPDFHVSTTEPDAYTFPVLLALSYVAGSARFQALPHAERAALLPPVLRLLRAHGPPADARLDTWAPPKFYSALMITAFYVVRDEAGDTGDLHALAMRAVLYEEPQEPCPVSMLAAASMNILAVLPAPATPDMDPGLLFDLGRKIARLLYALVHLYVDSSGDARASLLQEHQVHVPLETLLLPLAGQLLRMLGALEDLRPMVETIFCTTEPPDAPLPEEELAKLRGVEDRGLYARSPAIPAMMSSQSMPMVAMMFAYCMFAAGKEDDELFVARFGYEACAGVLISEMSEEHYQTFKKTFEDAESRQPLGSVSIYDEEDADVPDDAMSPDELLERLQRLQELGITHENPLELAAKSGLLEEVEARIQAEQRAKDARELAEAEAEVAKLRLGRS
ncbi:Uncharacterized protein MSYG_3733 [Malassezia sympodialis ATCC 42132]|uniref:Uncharacterized protein n=1 Tax=Malassezia sympodialis (strain ATCC 42132) TaxID=1230383 RepID=A0A1M8AB20_MALS4|nr:Uncharacterized protein MSYG_3733 [Malassezia sympodialis ATCC 42132]